MQPTVIRLLEAFAACAQEDANVADELANLRRMVEHGLQQNVLLIRLVRQLLEKTLDPAQVAALGEEIGKLESVSAQVTDAIAANP